MKDMGVVVYLMIVRSGFLTFLRLCKTTCNVCDIHPDEVMNGLIGQDLQQVVV